MSRQWYRPSDMKRSASDAVALEERRRERREGAETAIRVDWINRDGELKYSHGRTKDVSQSGIGGTLDEPLPVGINVAILLPDLDLLGFGTTCHCTRTGNAYAVGFRLASDWCNVSSAEEIADAWMRAG